MEEETKYKKPKIYNRDLNEAVEHIKEEMHEEIRGVAENLFKDLSKHLTHRLMLLTSASLLIALGISYTILTFSLKKSVREYAEQYISQGKQYAAAQKRIEKNQNELKNHYNELAGKYSSLNSIILDNANKIYHIGSIFDDLYEQNKKQILSLEDAVISLDDNIDEFKASFEQYKKSNEESINDLKNRLDQIEKESKVIIP